MQRSLLIATIILLFVLSGCGTQHSSSQTGAAELEKCEQIADENIKSKCYLYSGMLYQNENFCKKTNDDDAGNCYLSLAISKKDISFCESVPEGNLLLSKDMCYVNFMMRVSFNADDCSKISSASSKEQCIDNANRLKDCEAEGGKYKIPCYIAHALAEHNPDTCNNLENEAYQENCKAQVYSLLAGFNNDESECNKILDTGDVFTGTSLRASCLLTLSTWRGDDGALCSRVAEGYQSICFANYAVSWLNPDVCDKADEGADDCFYQVAQSTGDVATCRRITNIDSKDSCIAMLSILGKLNDKEICREIVNDYQRENCLKYQ